MSISGIYVLANQETNSVIRTDFVDIDVQNYKLEEGNKESEFGSEVKKVEPGETFSIIPKVFNLGMDCYLRIKVNYINDDTDFIDYVTGFSEDFAKYGEYYYYKTTLKSNENVKIFDTIKIPEDIASRISDGKIKLEVIAEAIQNRNFQPDYSLPDPWKNVKPSKTVNSTYEIDDESSKIIISYEDNTDKDITVSDNFFERARKIVPGDNFTDSIKIKNSNGEKVSYYLSLNSERKDIKEINLLNQIQLIITNKNGKIVYKGKLLSEDKLLLGEYKSGEDDELYFNVIVPEDLDNQFENLGPKLSLVFSSDYKAKEDIILPITGDPIIVAITIFCMSSIGLVTVVLLAYRERKKEY